MKRRVYFSIFALMFIMMVFISASAESKTIQMGGTGITFQVDSTYEVITNSNKDDFSQQIQNIITNDNSMIFYSAENGFFCAYYDQGKNLEQYDFRNKSSEDILDNYQQYVGNDFSIYGFIEDYEVSLYDNGEVKWLILDVQTDKSNHILYYNTFSGNKMVNFIFYPQLFPNISNKEYERIIDSVNFGNPSLWDGIKSIAGKITDFGKSILGTVGAVIIWLLIGPSIVGLVGYIFMIIIGVFVSIFKKKH